MGLLEIRTLNAAYIAMKDRMKKRYLENIISYMR
jgi:hypothetical protein